MNRTFFVLTLIFCLLLTAANPYPAAAAERLPADNPFVQDSVRTGVETAGLLIRSGRPAPSVAAGGQIGGGQRSGSQSGSGQPSQGTVATGSADGFVAYAFDDPAMEILVPPEWDLDEDTPEGLFALTIPGEFVFSAFNSFGDDSFPGLLGLALFRSQAAALVDQIDESIVLQTVDTFATVQGYPAVRIVFGGDMEGLDVTGAFYLLTGARDIYALIIITTDSAWAENADTVDIVVQNVRFDPQEGELVQAGDEPLAMTTASGGIGLTLPARWLLQETTDPDISFVVADEALKLAIAVAAAPPDDIDQLELEALRAQLESAAGETDPEALESIATDLFTVMDLTIDSDEFTLDQSLTRILPGDSPTIIFGGVGDFDEFVMPVFFLINLRDESLGLALVLGETADVDEHSETIIGLLQGLALPE